MSLKKQTCVHILSQFRRLEVQNQGVSRTIVLLKSLRKSPLLPPSSFWRFLQILDIPWLAAALRKSLLCQHMAFSLCASVFLYGLLIRTPVIRFRFHLIQHDLSLT